MSDSTVPPIRGRDQAKTQRLQAMGAMQHPTCHTIAWKGPGTVTRLATGATILYHPAAGIPSKTQVAEAKAWAPTTRVKGRTTRNTRAGSIGPK